MINYNQPWQELNVDVSNAFSKDFNAEKFRAESEHAGKPFATWRFRDDEILTVLDANWLKTAEKLGSTVGAVLLIYRDPHFEHPEVHVDLTREHTLSIYSLNWVFSPNDDSFMTWYDLPFETGKLFKDQSYQYRYWMLEQVRDKEFARHTIGNKLTLINTGLAHSVDVKDNPRWLISLRLKPNPNHSMIKDWPSAVDYFANTLRLIKT